MCVPSWFVWSAAHELPWRAVSLARLIISEMEVLHRQSHSHLNNVLICTHLLKIGFRGTQIILMFVSFLLLLWSRARQMHSALLS